MNKPIHALVRESAERFATAPAVDCEGRLTTYAQLAARRDAIARELLAAEVAAEEPVIILTTDTADLIAGILAVLEVGGAFVPLDPEFPTGRLEAITAALSPRLWLLCPDLASRLESQAGEPGGRGRVIRLESELPSAGAPSGAHLPVERDPDGLCYVYFTSGTTSQPKAIGGRLKAIDHFIRWETAAFELGEGVRVSHLTSPAFDASLRDFFVPLTVGGTVCAPVERDTLLDAYRLVAWLESAGVELVHTTPTLFRSLLLADPAPTALAALRHVLLAGEPLQPADVRRWVERFGSRIALTNLYGPSETTMVKFSYRVGPQDGEGSSIPVGEPMPGARAIVVDDHGRPCPPGKLGEIWIRTAYRSLGYLGQPELTRAVFIDNPFSNQPGDIVYRTGDLGRVREDGLFEVVGRRDQQVKVRGVRLELGPIESLLAAHPAVNEAVVVARTDSEGDSFLCAYVALAEAVDPETLRAHLASQLPNPMIPSLFLVLPALPRTLTGKVDRRALPDPRLSERIGAEHVAPQSPVEIQLAALWSELLGIARIGLKDSFFRLGGHSLLATLLLSRVRSTFGIELPLAELFARPTLEEVALAISQRQLEEESATDLAALLAEVEAETGSEQATPGPLATATAPLPESAR